MGVSKRQRANRSRSCSRHKTKRRVSLHSDTSSDVSTTDFPDSHGWAEIHHDFIRVILTTIPPTFVFVRGFSETRISRISTNFKTEFSIRENSCNSCPSLVAALPRWAIRGQFPEVSVWCECEFVFIRG